jgi:diaminopropionate ammonia-lyase family
MELAVEKICGLSVVENSCPADAAAPDFLCRRAAEPARRFHESLDGYAPTPLLSLPGLAAKLGLGAVFVKDESGRFGLKAFKGLGGSYAVFRAACERTGLDYEKTTQEDLRRPDIREKLAGVEFVTATDGNHGKGVAWAASGLGCRAHVYMPRGSVPARAEAIRAAGAYEVEITELCYDDAVRYAADKAEKNGWVLVQDTSWQGYEKVPSCQFLEFEYDPFVQRQIQFSKSGNKPGHLIGGNIQMDIKRIVVFRKLHDIPRFALFVPPQQFRTVFQNFSDPVIHFIPQSASRVTSSAFVRSNRTTF